MVRCEVISQGSACVTCAGLWAKTSQSRASVFEHNRDVAGVRFELRYRSPLSTSLPPSFRPPSSCAAAAPVTFVLKRKKRECFVHF